MISNRCSVFVAQICEKRFMRSDHLSKHVKIHQKKEAKNTEVASKTPKNETTVKTENREKTEAIAALPATTTHTSSS